MRIIHENKNEIFNNHNNNNTLCTQASKETSDRERTRILWLYKKPHWSSIEQSLCLTLNLKKKETYSSMDISFLI